MSSTLTMLDTGAAGSTDTQLETLLHLPGNGGTVAPAYASLACSDETDGSADGNQLSVANSLWGQSGMSFESTAEAVESPPVVRIDHAFLFSIRNTATGSILLMGQVTDPTAT